jgi:hypothetical protein
MAYFSPGFADPASSGCAEYSGSRPQAGAIYRRGGFVFDVSDQVDEDSPKLLKELLELA